MAYFFQAPDDLRERGEPRPPVSLSYDRTGAYVFRPPNIGANEGLEDAGWAGRRRVGEVRLEESEVVWARVVRVQMKGGRRAGCEPKGG